MSLPGRPPKRRIPGIDFGNRKSPPDPGKIVDGGKTVSRNSILSRRSKKRTFKSRTSNHVPVLALPSPRPRSPVGIPPLPVDDPISPPSSGSPMISAPKLTKVSNTPIPVSASVRDKVRRTPILSPSVKPPPRKVSPRKVSPRKRTTPPKSSPPKASLLKAPVKITPVPAIPVRKSPVRRTSSRRTPVLPPQAESPPPMAGGSPYKHLPLTPPMVNPTIPVINARPIGTVGPISPIVTHPGTETRTHPRPEINVQATDDNRPDYSSMTEEQKMDMRMQFSAKFRILRASYPGWNVQDPPTGYTLDQIHTQYEGYVKSIMVSLNCNQWKVYMIIFFLVFEIVMIKWAKLDMRGFTLSQVNIMSRYDRLLIELGERNFIQGKSNWPVEVRICILTLFNGVVFFAVKYLSDMVGGTEMQGTIQGIVDNLLGAENFMSNQTPGRDQFGIPVPPGTTNPGSTNQGSGSTPPSESPSGQQPGMENPLAGILGSLLGGGGNSEGGGGKGLVNMIANIGSKITSGITPDKKASKKGRKRAAPRRRPVFKS